MRRLLIAALLVTASTVATGAHAVSPGCTAAGFNQNTGPISCDYRAAGPGWFTAATPWPWQISASSDGGTTWRVLADEQRFGHPATGELRTVRGDLVRVQIGCWNDGRACFGYCPPGPLHAVNCYYEGSRAGAVIALNR